MNATEDHPIYAKVAHDKVTENGTQLWFITVDEGWRQGIVCERMYEWAANWLLHVLGRRPYAQFVVHRAPAGSAHGAPDWRDE